MRESYWDNLKFILIYCVVLGHCLGCCTTSGLSVALWDFVYLFHIPLFVFISGRFSNIQSNNYNHYCPRKSVNNSLKRPSTLRS